MIIQNIVPSRILQVGRDGGFRSVRIASVFGRNLRRSGEIRIPELFEVKEQAFTHIMAGALKVGELRSVLTPDKINGHKMAELQQQLRHSSDDQTVTYLSKNDMTAYIEGLKAKTGVSLRPMTGEEWAGLPREVKEQLAVHEDHWFWVEAEAGGGHRGALRSCKFPDYNDRTAYADRRVDMHTVLLVVDPTKA